MEVGAMPKEVIYRSGKNCLADVMVRWNKGGPEEGKPDDAPRVDLFMISQSPRYPTGGFWFEPDHPERIGLADSPIPEGERKPMVGPVSVDLNREQINRLIRTLRRARDQAYGADA
jgi:hypothetical protein